MNKVILTMIAIITIIGAIFTAYIIIDLNKGEEIVEQTKVSEEEIFDECTDEYESMQQETMKTASENEKTSPNASFIVRIYFKGCMHTIEQYSNLPPDLVNLTEEEIKEKYLNEYEVQSFKPNEVVLYKEIEGQCGEHYLVKDNEGIVTIYKVLEDGNIEKQEETSITTEYLPETDKINIQNGIRVNGKQELNKLIEDFE